MKTRFPRFALVAVATLGFLAVNSLGFAAVTAAVGYTASTYYANPHAAASESLVSFDWHGGDLYYSTGKTDWSTGFSVYKYDGSQNAAIYNDSSVYAGPSVKSIGDHVYFNDGGVGSRYTYDYFKYAPQQGNTVRVIDSVTSGNDTWGLQTRTGADLWAAGNGSTSVYYSPLDGNGNPTFQPMVDLGDIGASSGPLAFDAAGNLFYAQGYAASGTAHVYRFTAAEVAAALGDPTGAPLTAAGHEWAAIDGMAGATGLFVTDGLGLVLTATSFVDPSQLRLYTINSDGSNGGYGILAASSGRMSDTRYHDGAVYVTDGSGIYQIAPVPEPGSFALVVSVLGLALVVWRRQRA